MLISPEYLELNRELHASGEYGISGHRWAATAHALALQFEARSLLDYGCGQGTLKRAMHLMHAKEIRSDDGVPRAFPPLPYEVLEYDPAIPGKEIKPGAADIVVCGDVLEHIEPEYLEEVLDDIGRIARKAVLLVIETRPAMKLLPDGRNAHLIVRPAAWWLANQMILWRWHPVEFRDMGGKFVFVGTAQ